MALKKGGLKWAAKCDSIHLQVLFYTPSLQVWKQLFFCDPPVFRYDHFSLFRLYQEIFSTLLQWPKGVLD